MTLAAARVGDATSCPKDQPVEHKGGKIAKGSPNITINGKPAVRVGDTISGCEDGSDDVIAAGSGCVTFNGKPAARMSDATDHGGEITAGSGNVFISDSGKRVTYGSYGKITFGSYGRIDLGGTAAAPATMSSPLPKDPNSGRAEPVFPVEALLLGGLRVAGAAAKTAWGFMSSAVGAEATVAAVRWVQKQQ